VRSARDDIWIDMVQFDVRAADRLWEGIPPEHGAPGWYDDVSGLIETANGPAEPHELVDEPVVVEDMHQTTLGGPRRCRRGRTVGRLIAMKAAAATTASVVGIAAAAAATTGIVATVATVVVPAIEEHVLPADDERESATPATPRPSDTGGSPDTRADGHPIDPAAAPPAAPAPPAGSQPVDPEPIVVSASPAPAAPTAEAVAELPPPVEPAPAPPVMADPAPPPDPAGVAPTPPPATDRAPPAGGPRTDPRVGSGPIESASIGSEPAKPPRVVEPPPAIELPPADIRPHRGQRWSNERVDAARCARHACSGRRPHYGGGGAGRRDSRAKGVAEPVEQAPGG
jgi:hypothetical protein